jgi:23S rRNA (uracil1939-C5)-methyltransferase
MNFGVHRIPCLVVFILITSQFLCTFPLSFTLQSPYSYRRETALFSTAGKRPGAKWDRRRNPKKKSPSYQPKVDRPVLTNYDENRNSAENHRRLLDGIDCEHFGSCAGCVVNEKVGDVEVVKTGKRYFSSTSIRRNRLDVLRNGEDPVIETDDDGFYEVVVPSQIRQWRTQAKLVVAPRSSSWAKDGCIFGLYKKGSHEVLEIPNCQVHHPSINRAIAVLETATRKVGTAAYSKDSREGGLRYVQLQVERTTGRVCLTVIWASQDLKGAQPGLSRLTKELSRLEPDLWHSMWCHCNDGPRNNIFTRSHRSWYKLSGLEFLREPFAVGDRGWLYFSPLVFRQGNLDGFDIIANDVAQAVPGASKVCELYAGVGLLGLTSLMHHSQPGETPLTWVRCSDENPANPRCFSRTLSSL